MKKEALEQARAAYEIEAQCIQESLAYFDDEAFLSHVKMLEQNFREPKENEVFL